MSDELARAERVVLEAFGPHEDAFIGEWNAMIRRREESRPKGRSDRPILYRDWSEAS